jgi:hypothetical protein
MKKDKRSTFLKIISVEKKNGEDILGANATYLVEFMNLPSQERITQGKRLLSGLLQLDRTKKLFQLNESRRGDPLFYFLQMILRLSDSTEFMEYARGWFKRTHMRISPENFLLWTLFSFVYAQNVEEDAKIESIFQAHMNGENSFTSMLLESSITCNDVRDHKKKMVELLVEADEESGLVLRLR